MIYKFEKEVKLRLKQEEKRLYEETESKIHEEMKKLQD